MIWIQKMSTQITLPMKMMGAKVVMMIVNVEISVTSNDDKESKNLKVYLGKRDQNQGSWKLEH